MTSRETLQKASLSSDQQSLLDGLNQQQEQAVLNTEGAVVIFAGAGSGKTKVICTRIALLLSRNIAPNNILALTFTNKAAREMRERVWGSVGEQAKGCHISTFHAASVKYLRPFCHLLGYPSDFTIIDDSEQRSVIKQLIKELNLTDAGFTAKEIQGIINQCKVTGISALTFAGNASRSLLESTASEIYLRYEVVTKTNGQMDFGDLLVNFSKLIHTNAEVRLHYQKRFRYILVDEYQDTNNLQNQLVLTLSKHWSNVCIVGDDDQSIYSWRGANSQCITDFHSHFPETTIVKLEQNYRSTQTIINAASHLIRHNFNRTKKTLWTENPEGEKIAVVTCRDHTSEATSVIDSIHQRIQSGGKYNSHAIFYRTNAQSRSLEEACNKSQIPYRIYGGLKFFDRAEIKDILAYFKLLANPHHNVALLRTLNTPTRGIGKTTISKLTTQAAQTNTSLWTVVTEQLSQCQLPPRAHNQVLGYVTLIRGLTQDTATLPVSDLVQTVIEKTEYMAFLEKKQQELFQDKFQNIHELIASIKELETALPSLLLNDYLQLITLQTDLEDKEALGTLSDVDVLTMMTLHSAKGLEYEHVYMVGVEEGLLPHANSFNDEASYEEERRLCYVGMTRAKKTLMMTNCLSRMFQGKMVQNPESNFLSEIPNDLTARSMPQNNYLQPREHHDYHNVTLDLDESPKIDYSCNDEGLQAYPGMTVKHNTFGTGTITAINQSSMGCKFEVAFPNLGVKTILADYLTLVP